jgi:integrase/recombinase XerD
VKEAYFKDKIMVDSNYFLSQNGKALTVTAIEKIVKKAGVEANVRDHIRCSPHTLRHYYAQKQLRLGACGSNGNEYAHESANFGPLVYQSGRV